MFLMRFVDVMYSFPDILLIILIKAILGGGIYQLFFAIGFGGLGRYCPSGPGTNDVRKIPRFCSCRAGDGRDGGPYITERHLLPNSLRPDYCVRDFLTCRALFLPKPH